MTFIKGTLSAIATSAALGASPAPAMADSITLNLGGLSITIDNNGDVGLSGTFNTDKYQAGNLADNKRCRETAVGRYKQHEDYNRYKREMAACDRAYYNN